MSILRHRPHKVPELNTASLPDLIFTVLFFFMIVTHMRKVTLRVHITEPQGVELTRLARQTADNYIYIGRPLSDGGQGESRIQLNDKFVTPQQITEYMTAERQKLPAADADRMTVTIKADRDTKMGLMMEVKDALRRAKVLRIYYAATDKKH